MTLAGFVLQYPDLMVQSRGPGLMRHLSHELLMVVSVVASVSFFRLCFYLCDVANKHGMKTQRTG